MYSSLFAVQNCIIAHSAPHNVISAPEYRGAKSSGSNGNSEDEEKEFELLLNCGGES